jgi:hypothetical protein
MTGPKMGWEGFLQIWISSAWVDIKYVTDSVNLSDQASAEEAETRADLGNKTYQPGSFDAEITGKIQKRSGDTAFPALIAAYRARSEVKIRHSDDDPATVGADTYTAFMKVFNFSRAEPIGGIQTWDFTLKPCPQATLPARATTSS